MLRRKPLGADELAVAGRMKAAREGEQKSRTVVAANLRISPHSLANYELNRSSLPYAVGREFCIYFDMNQRWLAEGVLPQAPYVDLAPMVEQQIRPHATFLEGYKAIKQVIDDRLADWQSVAGMDLKALDSPDAVYGLWPAAGASSLEGTLYYLRKILSIHLRMISEREHAEFFEVILKTAQQFVNSHSSEARRKRSMDEGKKK